MFVKRTLAYLTVNSIRWRRGQAVAGREVQGRTGVGYGESEIELSEYVVCMWERLGEPESQKYPIPPQYMATDGSLV